MAQSSSSGKNEMSMEVRLMIFFVLMVGMMFLMPYFSPKPTPQPAGQKNATTQTPAQTPNPPAASAAEQPAKVPAIADNKSIPARAAEPAAAAAPPCVIETDLFKATFSNQGGSLRSLLLKKHKGNDNKPLELVNTRSGIDAPFSLYFPTQQALSRVNTAFYSQTLNGNLGVTYDYFDGHVSVKKTFRFEQTRYLAEVTTEVHEDGKVVPHMIEWRGGFGDLTFASPSANTRTLYFNVTDNKLVEQRASAAKDGPVTASGNFSFTGIADNYFAVVALPEAGSHVQQTTFSDTVPTEMEGKPQAFAGGAVSDGDINKFRLFIGPKDFDLLKRIDPRLEQVIDFGWLSILAKPLFLLVNWMNGAFVHNFGWAIVLVTIVLNFVLFPLKFTSMKSAKKMQALKPQYDAITSKYKGASREKKMDQQQEIMDLYKRNGVNPMGGCVPMLLQIPFFIAFYKVFTVSVEMRGATWLWVTDLSQPEHLAIHILPIVMIATQFLMQKMTPQANVDPGQQKMMMLMPLIFGVMFYSLPSGLVLYYLTSNLVNMGQQYFFNHTDAAQAAARSVEPPKKKIGRK